MTRTAGRRIKQKHMADDHYLKLKQYLAGSERFDDICVAILMRTGMRQEEFIRLRADHLDLDHCRIYIESAKGSNDRWMPLDLSLCQKVRTVAPSLLPGITMGDLLSNSGTEETQKRTLRRFFERALARAGVPKGGYSTHCLRHTFALKLFMATGNNIKKVQMAMGHRSLDSTAKYLEYLQSEDLHEEILRALA